MYATIENYAGYNPLAPCSGCGRRCFPPMTNALQPKRKQRQQCCNEAGNGCYSISGLGVDWLGNDDYYCCGRLVFPGGRIPTDEDKKKHPNT